MDATNVRGLREQILANAAALFPELSNSYSEKTFDVVILTINGGEDGYRAVLRYDYNEINTSGHGYSLNARARLGGPAAALAALLQLTAEALEKQADLETRSTIKVEDEVPTGGAASTSSQSNEIKAITLDWSPFPASKTKQILYKSSPLSAKIASTSNTPDSGYEIASYPSMQQAMSDEVEQPSIAVETVTYHTLQEIEDEELRGKVNGLQEQLPWESVEQCVNALVKNQGSVEDSVRWLAEDEEQ